MADASNTAVGSRRVRYYQTVDVLLENMCFTQLRVPSSTFAGFTKTEPALLQK